MSMENPPHQVTRTYGKQPREDCCDSLVKTKLVLHRPHIGKIRKTWLEASLQLQGSREKRIAAPTWQRMVKNKNDSMAESFIGLFFISKGDSNSRWTAGRSHIRSDETNF
jgi:hypothetical protein